MKHSYFIGIVVVVLLLVVASIAHGATACNAPALPVTGTRIVSVSTEGQLQVAMADLQAGDTILIADGTYNLSSSLYVNSRNNVTIRGNSGCDGVVLAGRGMNNTDYQDVPFGIWSNSTNTTIAHLTIRDTWDNALIFNPGAQSPRAYSVKLLNAGSQFIKANPTDAPNGVGVDNGVIEYSWMEYTAGTPAHAGDVGYTNGISAHAADGWIIRGNVFKDFHTPDSADYLWNPAVLMWNHSSSTLTERNTFINVDRAVAYGLSDISGFDHSGGAIRNNFVYLVPGLMSVARRADSDGAIIAWDSPNTNIDHNTVVTNDNVFYAVEFRFSSTTGGTARNNLADAPVHLRDSATATVSGNFLSAVSGMFVNSSAANLHLQPTASDAIDQAPALASVVNDFDGDSRPQGTAYDIGADEYSAGGSSCLFCDDFEDGLQPAWNVVKPNFTEAGGSYVGVPAGRKAESVATPVFGGCSACSVEVHLRTSGGEFGKVWILAWYADKNNLVELLVFEARDRIVLKQRVNKTIVRKEKAPVTVEPDVLYDAVISFDGANFHVLWGGLEVLAMTAGAGTPPFGSVGFRVKGTTGTFEDVSVD